MRSRIIEEYKSKLFLSDRQKEILVGAILGDGHLEKLFSPKLSRLKIEHSYKQRKYVDWFYKEFRNWVRTKPKQKIKKAWNKIYINYGFSTYGHRLLGAVQKEFYSDRKKVIPSNLFKNVTPLVLAVWYMDDGSVKSNKHKGVFLNTQGFRGKDVKTLQDVLKNKFGVASSTRKDQTGKQIYIGGKFGEKFIRIIEPFIILPMRYKIPRVLRLTELPKE